jgi:hypothetical protein
MAKRQPPAHGQNKTKRLNRRELTEGALTLKPMPSFRPFCPFSSLPQIYRHRHEHNLSTFPSIFFLFNSNSRSSPPNHNTQPVAPKSVATKTTIYPLA